MIDTKPIIYRDRLYKYQLVKDATVQTDIKRSEVTEALFSLTENGVLTAYQGYAWDGPSGPTIDTPSFMRGSLFHDVLYQMIREGMIPDVYRKNADDLLRRLCIEDGMSRIRAWWVYRGVRRFAGFAARPGSSEAEIKKAP